jgi:hypothetical protein
MDTPGQPQVVVTLQTLQRALDHEIGRVWHGVTPPREPIKRRDQRAREPTCFQRNPVYTVTNGPPLLGSKQRLPGRQQLVL